MTALTERYVSFFVHLPVQIEQVGFLPSSHSPFRMRRLIFVLAEARPSNTAERRAMRRAQSLEPFELVTTVTRRHTRHHTRRHNRRAASGPRKFSNPYLLVTKYSPCRILTA